MVGSDERLLKGIDVALVKDAAQTQAAAGVLLEGEPRFRLSVQDLSQDGHVQTGVWEATPGTTRSRKGETFEFCCILSGVVEITENGGEPRTYRAGDAFVMKPGFTGTWKTIETVRKYFVIVTP